MKRLLLAVLLSVLSTACGNVKLIVTPGNPTVPADGNVTLTATTTGSGSIFSWWVQESWDPNDPNSGCWKIDPQLPLDFTGCPYGIVVVHDPLAMPNVAVYYAPQIAGTYQVVVRAMHGSGQFPEIEQSTATITVTK